jgi:2-methylcitrate dehydratase PrpD
VLASIERRVTVIPDAGMERVFPAQRRAIVTVTDRAGQRHEAVRNTRKGDPDDPLTDAELAAKFEDLSEPVLGAGRSARLAGQLWRLDELATVSDLEV